MAEYIDREKAIELLDEIFDKTDPEGSEQIVVLKCRKAVRELPTADVQEVKHGEWETDGLAAVCSLCKTKIVIEQYDGEMNYCMNCGGKLDDADNVRK